MKHLLGVILRMAFGVLSFLLLVQLPIIFASGFLEHSKACGTYHVSSSDDLHYELFYINGELVDKNVFCESLIIDDTNRCFDSGNVGYQQCGLSVLLDTSASASGRKFLLENDAKEGSRQHDSVENEADKNQRSQNSIFTPEKLAIAAQLSFIFCCAICCPCLRAKRKGSSHYVSDNDPVSVDSSAPLELHSVHEKVPPSPLRVPPSPLRVPPSPSRFSMSPGLNRIGSVHLNMTQALRATQNFSSSLKIGEGGFGTVYKAHLPDGGFVAIKRAKKEHVDTLTSEFKSEVELLAKIEHRNLVRLLGYVDKGHERLIITEFVPNGTLREHLDGARGKILDFNQRLEIAIDVAHALTYLHLYAEKPIIHRDVKSSNILLTESMRAKVADFGFARLGDTDADKTHISTKVKGTVGYLDPEYMKTYQLTPKSDVYSFGVLLLEILTGRRPVEMKKPPEERVTLRWAFGKFTDGNTMDMLDPAMRERIDAEILGRMFELSFQCAAPTRADRPDMKMVGERLWAVRMEYSRRGRRE
ncbi:PREDICTED: calmodulin-binding receptor-like cytoplasmic kinase 3 [Ipomoea nil]|uniref:calmodulin-binding receptor-like cytoplasmic kinase 3 n=1 Tax=Ipomoea nil TaxID=35883 RepID=UPI0009019D63|nr:PREDICTED: calmodulin-binding receptor-like cytoplasmic kinase 3 [Ipomoea nil]XP_019198252.1 PREDICTED: calmodulin-binding receptor-like cytoplasmic kinase 3 [Ipomoea nil]